MNAEQQKKNKIMSILMKTEVSMVAIIAIIFIAASLGTQNFLTAYNLTNILKQCAIIGIISIAETYVIITAGIDISCGAIVGMSTLIVAMSQAKWGLSVPVSLLLGILIAIILAGSYSVYLLIQKKVDKKSYLAFGPYLSIGIVIAFIYGQEIIHWYLSIMI